MVVCAIESRGEEARRTIREIEAGGQARVVLSLSTEPDAKTPRLQRSLPFAGGDDFLQGVVNVTADRNWREYRMGPSLCGGEPPLPRPGGLFRSSFGTARAERDRAWSLSMENDRSGGHPHESIATSARLLAARSRALAETPTVEWDGVFELTSK